MIKIFVLFFLIGSSFYAKSSDLKPGVQHLKLIALDDDVMPDQMMLDFNPALNGYLLPGIPLVQ